MSSQKELPISMQSFRQIVAGNCIYVDKTEHIYNLAKSRKLYFLSRPRRFGKSLLVSIIKNLFEGREDLFEGLWIRENRVWEWTEHPVVLIDFNGMPHASTEELKIRLNFILEEKAHSYGLDLKAPFVDMKFRELILKLKEKTGMDVVVLVDGYDKPIIDFIGRGSKRLEIAMENRDFMKGFYGILKESNMASSLRFVLITGVSKFTKISIFSELNNLDDLTMQEKYCDMLGYTHDELISYFNDRIDGLVKKSGRSYEKTLQKLDKWYCGFRFSNKDIRVYNPVSILKVLNELSFENFWFETGSPTFLINLLKEKKRFPPDLEKFEAGRESFSTYDIESLDVEPVLFQTGYLSIRDVKEQSSTYSSENVYILSYPNEEVRTSLTRLLR